jgi:hypothetical protein
MGTEVSSVCSSVEIIWAASRRPFGNWDFSARGRTREGKDQRLGSTPTQVDPDYEKDLISY